MFRGSYPIPAFPAPHPGESPPPDEDPTPEQILDPPPCGYVLSEQQYSRAHSPTADRWASASTPTASRWPTARGADDYWVPMDQPQRGLIPLLLDGQAAEPMIAAERVAC